MSEFYLIVIAGLTVCAAFGYWLLADSDRGASGVVLGILLGPVGVIVAAILRGQPPSRTASEPAAPSTARVLSGQDVVCWNCHRTYDRSLDRCPHCGKRAVKL